VSVRPTVVSPVQRHSHGISVPVPEHRPNTRVLGAHSWTNSPYLCSRSPRSRGSVLAYCQPAIAPSRCRREHRSRLAVLGRARGKERGLNPPRTPAPAPRRAVPAWTMPHRPPVPKPGCGREPSSPPAAAPHRALGTPRGRFPPSGSGRSPFPFVSIRDGDARLSPEVNLGCSSTLLSQCHGPRERWLLTPGACRGDTQGPQPRTHLAGLISTSPDQPRSCGRSG